jgi:hypothetical protein
VHLRNGLLDNLEEAIVASGNNQNLRKRASNGKKIRMPQEKMNTGSRTHVTSQNAVGEWIDLTNKQDIKGALINNNRDKVQ